MSEAEQNRVGSSPRRRGKPVSPSLRFGGLGLIPAWAGKTRASVALIVPSTAHPRVGGENPREALTRSSQGGSSPRGRGKRRHRRRIPRHQRLIPAWAGKTTRFSAAVIRRPAHPRVGGENRSRAGGDVTGRGSSPRGRGKLRRWAGTRARGRLIPAWAGKTGVQGLSPFCTSAHPRVGGENFAP